MAIRVFKAKKKSEIENNLIVAYFGARWQRVEKLSFKDLKEAAKLLNGDTKPKQMTADEMYAEVRKLNAAMGGAVNEIRD
ncbi:hypothetical protein [Bacillus sp. B-jedd]|uniref:hypothetical protein n=1 Tax=Bacillus sp. B-jedd TaxID=1476857 RepID=UPI000662757B|nr:hypothetical protein [Bacillus sp. B-jedd]